MIVACKQRRRPVQGYDPLKAPVAAEWLALGETERIALVEAYHRKARVRVPNMKVHATMHAIVENQAALGEETPVLRTLARLVGQGVDRHEAVHAVASILIAHISDIASGRATADDPNVPYFAELEKLTVKSWRRDFG
jgi:hypothetical protein